MTEIYVGSSRKDKMVLLPSEDIKEVPPYLEVSESYHLFSFQVRRYYLMTH